MWKRGGESGSFDAYLYIAALGPEAKELVPVLLKNMNFHGAWALWSVDPPAAIPFLTSQCDIATDAPYRRYWSSEFFRMVGPRTRNMAEALTEGMRDGKVGEVAEWAKVLAQKRGCDHGAYPH